MAIEDYNHEVIDIVLGKRLITRNDYPVSVVYEDGYYKRFYTDFYGDIVETKIFQFKQVVASTDRHDYYINFRNKELDFIGRKEIYHQQINPVYSVFKDGQFVVLDNYNLGDLFIMEEVEI